MNLNKLPLELLTNNIKNSFYHYLKDALNRCKSFSFSVAFISDSGMQLIIDELKLLEAKGIPGRLITTNYEYGTTPNALELIFNLKNIDSRLYDALPSGIRKFHTKAYIFEMDNHYEIVVGSSNMTQYALKSNHEWNLKHVSKSDFNTTELILKEFDVLFNDEQTKPLTRELINNYKDLYNQTRKGFENEKPLIKFFLDYLKANPKSPMIEELIEKGIIDSRESLIQDNLFSTQELKPNTMQDIGLEGLYNIRQSGGNKALIIAATGTGKTYLAAFDALQVKPKKLLFVVHRAKILKDALRTFKSIMPDISMGEFRGSKKELHNDYVFATVQTMSRLENLNLFKANYFDYIILDEAHRTAADGYLRIMNYFKPKFLLGMTATPERTDSKSIYELYDNQIAIEIRLREALLHEMIVPFHYFGITDITTDLSDINLNSRLEDLAEKLNVKARVDLIIENIEKYKHAGEKTKALGYCAHIKHAHYMAESFNKRGYPSIALTGDSTEEEREAAINRLENDSDPLSYIFTVEIFNEGIDIPSVNLILMLRPTESPIIFTQQLGRGLRKYKDKEYLTVLDFIGNHNKNFLIPVALAGDKAYDKDDLIVSTANDFFDISGETFIRMDPISKKRILNQLEAVNFNEMSYLKESYQEIKNKIKRVPMLTDFPFDAFDPVRLIKKRKTYLHFVASVERSTDIYNELLSHNNFNKVIEYLDGNLPVKRVYEFAIIKELIAYKKMDMDKLFMSMRKYVDNPGVESFNHAIETINQKYMSITEKKKYFEFVEIKENYIRLTSNFLHVIEDQVSLDYIQSTLSYGLARYHHEHGRMIPAYPHVKMYQEYSKSDIYKLALFDKNVSGLLMSGVVKIGNDYFLTVNLEKENVAESIDYQDYFIGQERFHWQSQNHSTQTNETGLNLINHVDRGYNLHLFVRKSATEAKDNKGYSRNFIYLGKVIVEKYEGNAPISFEFKFENKVPSDIYERLTYNYEEED